MNRLDGVAQMAKEMEHDTRAKVVQDVDHAVDPAAILAELLAQHAGPSTVVTGPEWTTQFRPPAIPGTANDKYVKAALPLRAFGFFVCWVTWNWKHGAFCALVTGLVLLLIKTR